MKLKDREKKKARFVFLSTGNKGVKLSLAKGTFKRVNRLIKAKMGK
jgi:hypothetical protein